MKDDGQGTSDMKTGCEWQENSLMRIPVKLDKLVNLKKM